jgi:hypothetical protein
MPTNAHADSRFAHMTAAEVLAETQRMVSRWELEDAARRARNAARLASL